MIQPLAILLTSSSTLAAQLYQQVNDFLPMNSTRPIQINSPSLSPAFGHSTNPIIPFLLNNHSSAKQQRKVMTQIQPHLLITTPEKLVKFLNLKDNESPIQGISLKARFQRPPEDAETFTKFSDFEENQGMDETLSLKESLALESIWTPTSSKSPSKAIEDMDVNSLGTELFGDSIKVETNEFLSENSHEFGLLDLSQVKQWAVDECDDLFHALKVPWSKFLMAVTVRKFQGFQIRPSLLLFTI